MHRLYLAKAHLEYGEMLLKKGVKDKARTELQTALAAFDEIQRAGALDPAFVPHHERIKALLARA